ncbi:MAG: phosphotransferase [Bacteroidales bacterium]|jgi:aminoglycoside/choline kinase family phosphotransferase|nr:phosphotransferase [Bacteroidales bacterium]
MNTIEKTLLHIAQKRNPIFVSIEKLPLSGSHRQYFRIFSNEGSVIGVYNKDIKENISFFTFTRFFISQNINVPKIITIDESHQFYLLEDLGDETLFSFLNTHRTHDIINTPVVTYYKKVLKQLPLLQLCGKKGIDFSVCYPRFAFDKQSMLWDLNYFKYYFLKLANIPFDEQLLEDDFHCFIDFLLETDNDYFMFRDFQSRNIMLHHNEPFFIDYQGGRKGALQYDIASLLYDGKADLPPDLREELLLFYLKELESHISINTEEFCKYYYGFVLIRILQALGTYGFRGYYERKSHFLLSIPFAIKNLKYIIPKLKFSTKIPTLIRVIQQITESELVGFCTLPENRLTVTVNSFSYKKGIPQDFTANGGGFVFDCRALPNPGRLPEYKKATGKEENVIDYLESFEEIKQFKSLTTQLISQALDNYIERNFSHLMVNFGCTGGQHRSVYFTEKLAEYLREHYSEVNVVIKHWEEDESMK